MLALACHCSHKQLFNGFCDLLKVLDMSDAFAEEHAQYQHILPI